MRSYTWRYVLCILLFISVPVMVLADSNHYSPSLIIPTKYRFLLLEMAESEEQKNPQTEPAVQTENKKVPEAEPDTQEKDLEDALSDFASEPSYSGMGRGYVETHFDVSFEEPGRKIDNRERMTARGLFDVHVKHGFN